MYKLWLVNLGGIFKYSKIDNSIAANFVLVIFAKSQLLFFTLVIAEVIVSSMAYFNLSCFRDLNCFYLSVISS